LLARLIMSWVVAYVRKMPRPLLIIYGVLYDLTEPVLRLARPLIPPLRMGAAALDLSPLLVFFILVLVTEAVCRAAA
jgi:YggT family protein